MWRVLLLNTKDCSPNLAIVRSVEDALRQHPSVSGVWNAEYPDALHTAIHQQCNLLLAVDSVWLDRGLCRRLAQVCGTSALWTFEDPYNRPANLENAPLFDRVFTNDLAGLSHYGDRGVHLPLAANPRFHDYEVPSDEDESRHYLYDLFFVGAPWPNRVRLLQKLAESLGDVRYKFGLGDVDFRKLAIGRDHELAPRPLDLPQCAYSWRASNAEMARLANRSRIVLMLHREFTGYGDEQAASTPGPRLFEAALAGGFQLADLSLREVTQYYELDRELAGFRGAEQCLEQVRHYLHAPGERLAMARAAQERTRREHLYAHRVDVILSSLGQPTAAVAMPTVPASRTSSPQRTKRVLFVYHNHITAKTFGGVEVYVDQLSRSLPPRYEPYLFFPDRNDDPHGNVVRLLDVRGGRDIERRFETPLTAPMLREREREGWFAHMLHELHIDMVHFLHMLGHPWSLPLVARSLGLPTLFTVMDYYPVCLHLNLLRQGHYCDAPNMSLAACDSCLAHHHNITRFSQAARRAYVGRVLDAVDTIIPLCKSTRDILIAAYPHLPARTQLTVEGLPLRDYAVQPAARRPVIDRLRVAVPGSFYGPKGSETLIEVLRAMRHEAVDFHVFGHVDDASRNRLAQLNLPNVTIHGSYSPETACSQLLPCDVGLLLSIWPETYVITLSEVWRAGVVPIVTDIGALGERVTHERNGFKVPVEEPGAVVHLLRQLMAEPARIEQARQGIHPGLYRSMSDHVQILTDVYDRLADRYALDVRDSNFFVDAPRSKLAEGGNTYLRRMEWVTGFGEIGHGLSSGTPAPCAAPAAVPTGFNLASGRANFQRLSNYLRTNGLRRTVERSLQEIKRIGVR